MRNKLVLVLATVIISFPHLFTGCGSGISQEEYNKVSVQLQDSQTQVAQLQSEIKASQAQVDGLKSEIAKLKERYELVGKTPGETAEKIVKRYHEMHVYSEYDLYVCSDMALGVWDMLKAQGINAVIQVGRVDRAIKDITETDHAWVLAEVSPGEYLALETTQGYTISKKDNPLYYQGWSFQNPKEFKKFFELMNECNTRANIINQSVSKADKVYEQYKKDYAYYQQLNDEFNRKYVGRPVSSESQALRNKIESQLAIVKEKEGKYNQLQDLIKDQKQELENKMSEMRKLVS